MRLIILDYQYRKEMTDNKFHFGAIKENIRQMKVVLPIQLASQAQTYFVSSWQKQGWDGQPWQEVKRRQEGTPEYKYPKKYGMGRRTSAILVSSSSVKGKSGGTLRRAVGNSIRSQVFGQNGIRLVVDLPYAAIHNYGLPMARGGNMPMRSFMKDSPILRTMQITKIKTFTDKVWTK